MNEAAQKIQIVINTLEQMDIPSTYKNTAQLLGVYQLLIDVRDALGQPADAPETEGTEDEADG